MSFGPFKHKKRKWSLPWKFSISKPISGLRVETSANFAYAGPFNEMVLLGVLAIRLKGLNKVLKWDGENMDFTNIDSNETMTVVKTNGFEMVNGIPTWNTDHIELNALESATEYIKHTYRDGWNLPDMPA